MKYALFILFMTFNTCLFSQSFDDYTINGGVSAIDEIFELGDIFVVEKIKDNPLEIKKTIIAYPNPFENTVFVFPSEDPKINKIIIHDITGKIVKEEILTNNTIELNNLPSGVYFLNFIDR